MQWHAELQNTHRNVDCEKGNVDLPAGMTGVTQLHLQEQRQHTDTDTHILEMSHGPGSAMQQWQCIQNVLTAWWHDNGMCKIV